MSEIRCLCLDCDGVLTDGRLYTDAEGHTARAFHVHDGFAIRCFRELGGLVVIVSGKSSGAIDARARELGIARVIQGSVDKLADLEAVLVDLGLRLDQVAMVGDDLPDLPIMKKCGFPIAVANAAEEVKSAARLVTQASGGHGAVREVIEHLLRASGRWQEVLQRYGASAGAGERR